MRKTAVFLVLISSFILFNLTVKASVVGGTTFEILGLDSISNSLYFSKFIGDECDCPVELWIYNLQDRNFEINKNWIVKMDYEQNKEEAISKSNLIPLQKIDTVSNLNHSIYQIEWLESERRYDPVVEDTVDYFPYELVITDTSYIFGQWFEKKTPKILLYLLDNSNTGFLIITPFNRLGARDKIIFFVKPEIINKITLIENSENSESEDRDAGVIVSIIGMFTVVMIILIRRKKKKRKK